MLIPHPHPPPCHPHKLKFFLMLAKGVFYLAVSAIHVPCQCLFKIGVAVIQHSAYADSSHWCNVYQTTAVYYWTLMWTPKEGPSAVQKL